MADGTSQTRTADHDDYADPALLDAPPGPGLELVGLAAYTAGVLSGLVLIVWLLAN